MQLPISVRSDGADHLQQQIVRQITTLIENGMLRAGDSLPATRQISAQLGVARNTVSSRLSGTRARSAAIWLT